MNRLFFQIPFVVVLLFLFEKPYKAISLKKAKEKIFEI